MNFSVDDGELVNRLTGRRVCPKCGAAYHTALAKPEKSGVCDRCGSDLIQRDDDKEETIRKRLSVYKKETQPLIDYYRREGTLKEIEGLGEPGEIFKRLSKALGLNAS